MIPTAITGPFLGKAAVCESILRSLPEWFGVEAAVQQYARDIDHLPTFLALAGETVVGFLTLKQHNEFSAEVYVLGIRKEFHHQGIGRRLFAQVEAYLIRAGVEYLQVKTLGPSNPDGHYARTRAFYLALGFRPLEEFRELWDEANPCLLMVKKLEK